MAATMRSEGLVAFVRLKSPPLTDAHGFDGVPVLKALNQADLERQQWFAERSTFDTQLRDRDEEQAASAKFDNGVLNLQLPKKLKNAGAQKLRIE